MNYDLDRYIGAVALGRIRATVNHALCTGALVPAERCEDCGKREFRLNGHHEDYSKPLEVVWVCAQCHGRRHARLNVAALIAYWGPPKTRGTQLIRQLLVDGETMKELAERAGVSLVCIHNKMRNGSPQGPTAVLLQQRLGIPVESWLEPPQSAERLAS